jgi:hypothetical protein
MKLGLFSLCLCEVERHAPRHGNLRFETLTLALARFRQGFSSLDGSRYTQVDSHCLDDRYPFLSYFFFTSLFS